jgi:hypothetical protein
MVARSASAQLSPAPCVLPDFAGRYERIVSGAERALLVDVERARESQWIHRGWQYVRMITARKHGELIAEAHIAGAE